VTRVYESFFVEDVHRDLADLDNDGHLTRDGFAIAMHLIKRRITGGDIPSTLPPALVPPSRLSYPTATAVDKQVDLLLDESPTASPSQYLPKAGNSHTYPLPAQLSLSPQATEHISTQKTSTQSQSMQPTFSNPSSFVSSLPFFLLKLKC
jgi:epidermal growth factor receptor substrate 15